MDWDLLAIYWGQLTAWAALIDLIITFVTIGCILWMKKEPVSAVAWCLTVLLLPFFGSALFWMLGYQTVHRPLTRIRRYRRIHRKQQSGFGTEGLPRDEDPEADGWHRISRLAQQLGSYPPSSCQRIDFYHDGQPAYDAMLAAIHAAKHHVHVQTFIFQPDASGRLFLDALTECARRGVEVRVLYDAMGSYRMPARVLRPLQKAGGKVEAFFPLNPLRRRIQVNLRNHRKIQVTDGHVAFTGGMNLGDEYLGKGRRFKVWRDTQIRLEGNAVNDIQAVFAEDWHFASGELLGGDAYFPKRADPPGIPVQILHSGPDQTWRCIREVYFAAIMKARKRIWIATPYIVPDAGLLDAICLSARYGVDVRLLCLTKPDKWLPFLAGRYYWTDLMEAGVKVYQYVPGMMHAKMMMIDGEWASVGTANLDNRSLHLNFEVTCVITDTKIIDDLDATFERDLLRSTRVDWRDFQRRSFGDRLAENFCRLLSPVL
jgi:cardiolipin synthase